ncbi:MAG: lactate utilization protein [Pyrinomonadaceae bacterium]
MSKETDTAKASILSAIRQNLAAGAAFDEAYLEHQPEEEKDQFSPTVSVASGDENLVEMFCENLRSVGGICETVPDRSQAAKAVEKIIDQTKAEKMAVSDSELIIEISGQLKSKAEILRCASKEKLFECDLGMTGAQLAVAETGTLVIESDREFNRLTSLVPPVHVCLLETGKIRRTMGEALEILKKDLSRSITFITGPSRTSDIELTLAIGVHGPARLFVILIDEKK